MRASNQLFFGFVDELTVATFCLLAGSVLWVLGVLPVGVAVALTSVYLTVLVFWAWYRFDGGRHLVFLFLGLLLVFQGGRLLGSAVGATDDPFRIELGWQPFDVSPSTQGITLLMLALSGTLVYLPCRLLYKKTQLRLGKEGRLLPVLYWMFWVTVPFIVVKEYVYLQYAQAHGGYYSLYTGADDVEGSVGLAVRLLALLATQAFMAIYLIERRPRRLFLVTTFFMLVSIGDLLIGFRGKVFTLILTLWFIRNLKRGKRFPLPTLVVVGVILSFVAVGTVAFREQRAMDSLNPVAFFAGQGISFNVTESAVEFRHLFAPHGVSYLFHDLYSTFVPIMNAKSGERFDQDLSVFLNPIAYSYGPGTGSAYLADSYVAGGMVGVCIASLALGLAFAWIQRLGGRLIGGIVVICFGQFLIYTPRAGLLEPIAQALRTAVPFCVILLMSIVITDRYKFIFGSAPRASQAIAPPEEGDLSDAQTS